MERGSRAGGWSAAPLAARNATAHVMRLALPAAGVLVTATYDKDPALVSGMLNGARMTRWPYCASTIRRSGAWHGSPAWRGPPWRSQAWRGPARRGSSRVRRGSNPGRRRLPRLLLRP